MWEKIKSFFKKYWHIIVTFIIGLFAFIFGRQSKRDRILDDTTKRSDEFRSHSTECGSKLEEARRENTKSTERIESSIRESEEIRRTNSEVGDTITDARQTISGLQSAIEQHINELRASEED